MALLLWLVAGAAEGGRASIRLVISYESRTEETRIRYGGDNGYHARRPPRQA